MFKAFQLYLQWEDGGGPEKDQNLLLELVLYSLTLGNSSLLSSSLLLSATGAGLVFAFLSSFSSFSPSLLLDFWLPTEPSSDAFLFLSCQYCLPPFLCSFFPDMAHCTLLLGIPYFLAISAWNFLLMTQSLTAIKSNADCSPTLLIALCNFSAFSPCTFGSYSSCTVLGSSVTHCYPYIDDTFSSVVTLTIGNIGIPTR